MTPLGLGLLLWTLPQASWAQDDSHGFRATLEADRSAIDSEEEEEDEDGEEDGDWVKVEEESQRTSDDEQWTKIEAPEALEVPELNKPDNYTLQLAASLGCVGTGALFLLRGATLRAALKQTVENPDSGCEGDPDVAFESISCHAGRKLEVNSRLALGYGFLGVGAILGFTLIEPLSGTDVAVSWSGVW